MRARVVMAVAVLGLVQAACGEGADVEPALQVEETSTVSQAATAGAAAETPAFFQPKPEPEEGSRGPFWQTTFGVAAPEGHWEPGDGYDCRLTGEGDYRLETDRGTKVAAFDLPGSIVFGRTDSVVDGASCVVFGVAMGDFDDDLANGYALTDGTITATFTPEELFSGQDDGTDTVKALG